MERAQVGGSDCGEKKKNRSESEEWRISELTPKPPFPLLSAEM